MVGEGSLGGGDADSIGSFAGGGAGGGDARFTSTTFPSTGAAGSVAAGAAAASPSDGDRRSPCSFFSGKGGFLSSVVAPKNCIKSPKVRIGSLPFFMASVIGMSGLGLGLNS